jgi:cobalt-zinc-cadmium efflux system membrane fusion protein
MILWLQSQLLSLNLQIASPTEQDFEVTIKAAGKIDVPPENRAKVLSLVVM